MSSLLLDMPSQLGLVQGLPTVTRRRAPVSLHSVFRTYRWSVLLAYGLFSLENLLSLARPWLLGLAVDDLLHASYRGAILLAVQHLSFALLSTGRQMYDTRAFTRIYADMATGLVLQQRRQDVEISRVAARSALSREIVDFFEHNVPYMFQSVYSVVGAVVMLALCDGWMVPACLLLLLPVYLLSVLYARKTYLLNNRLNDELEREVEIIARARRREVRRHYREVRDWRIKLSNFQAANFCLLNVFVMGMVAVALLRCCLGLTMETGRIFAMLGYVTMFVVGLGNTPLLVQQLSRLRDITHRIQGTSDASGSVG